ncbi:MAG TPA: SufE family protein [Gemmatimonadales bacterium]
MTDLPALDRFVRRFSAADRDTRLEALLDLSRKLPPLPDRYTDETTREAHRVPECMTPVFLFVELDNGGVHLHADVPRESPTVRGFVSLLVTALDGAPAGAVATVPDDLLHALKLEETLGMMRTHGLTAIVQRIKRMVAQAALNGRS